MAERGQCILSCIPVRSEGRSEAELVTQLLYGETYEVLQHTKDWIHIRIDYDGYEGWISANQYNDQQFPGKSIVASVWETNDGVVTPLGSEVNRIQENKRKGKLDLAKDFLGSPYLWGGKTFMGIDCSGFMQVVHKAIGVQLPRDASQQVNCGEEVLFGDQKAGDLAFFISKSGNINHVGLLLDEASIIHASGRVRIDKINERGIELSSGGYSHDFHSFRRL